MTKQALVFWFTGLSGSGKTTVAERVKPRLKSKGFSVLILDGDEVRGRRPVPLGFSEKEIKENNCQIAGICLECRLEHDAILVPVISPYAVSRRQAKEILGSFFYEVYFDADLETVMGRDVKGLYGKAKKREIGNLIGFSPEAPYESPVQPDWVVRSGRETVEDSVRGLEGFIMEKLAL